MAIKVKLKGTEYWLIADSLNESGAIAPLEHCDSEGEVVELFELSYAHYYPDRGVLRFGEKIADASDLEVLSEAQSSAPN